MILGNLALVQSNSPVLLDDHNETAITFTPWIYARHAEAYLLRRSWMSGLTCFRVA